MSRRTKNWLIAAAVLVAVGLIMVSATVSAVYREYSFEKLNTTQFVTNTYGISEKFSRISVDTDTADILITTAEDGRCSVVCYEPEKLRHTVNVQNGTLTIKAVDERDWSDHIGMNFTAPKITVYLPGEELASLVVKESTGDIEISNVTAGTVDLSVSTGDVTVADVVCNDLLSHGSTGKVTLRYVTAEESISIKRSTGDIEINNVAAGTIDLPVSTSEITAADVTCKKFLSQGSSGEVTLRCVTAEEKISIERSTGDVDLESSDANEIYVKTSTGDISGSLRSEKIFFAESSTGEVSVPQSMTGGKCELISSTGDIFFSKNK